jgi:hypothetical protein
MSNSLDNVDHTQPDDSVELDEYVAELGDQRRAAKDAESAADLWLALALRKLARDPDLLSALHRKIEDMLIESRDSGRFVGARDGLAVYGKNSEPPDVIRIGTRMTVTMILQMVADHLEGA